MRGKGNVMLVEDWLRGCVHHDGRHGEVTLPCDEVLNIADYIERTRNKVEVVRCKDCKYLSRITSQVKVGEWFGCLNDKGLACCVQLDDYCSYGERGEADDNRSED